MKRVLARLVRRLLGVHYRGRGRHTKPGANTTPAYHAHDHCTLKPAPSTVDDAFAAIAASESDLAERFRLIDSVMGGGTAEEVTQ